MTTIAASVKHGTMAADSKCVFGDMHFPVVKIFRLPDGSLLGTAGSALYTAPFEAAMLAGKVYIPIEPVTSDTDFAALHLTKHGLFLFDVSFYSDRVGHGLCAIGTGGMIAYSYLLDGESPALAVTKACAVDINSGLPVQTETMKGKR